MNAPPHNLRPRYNVCPTGPVGVVTQERELVTMRWGLVPWWWSKPLKELRMATFNARAETVETKPVFRDAFKRSRCLIPMSGYFEWQNTPSGKQPRWDERKDRLHDCSIYVLLKMTRGEVLRYAIAYALRRSRKIIRGLKKGLSEYERHAVADHVVAQLKERGDPWRLNEEAPTAKPPTT